MSYSTSSHQPQFPKSADKSLLLSTIYAVGRFSLGLLIHPYQTMQLLIEEKLFMWMTLLPSGVLLILTISWKGLVRPLILLAIYNSLLQSYASIILNALSFLANWVIFFCLYWQAMLIYLLIRFEKARGLG